MAMVHESALNGGFNLSTAQSTTVLELAALIWKKMDGEKPLRYVSDPPFDHDVQRRVLAVEKARNMRGFEAKTTLTDMLDHVIPWITDAVDAGRV